MKVHGYQAYLLYKEINESIDDILQGMDIDNVDTSQIQDLVDSQDEIFNKYDIPDTEIQNIKSGIEDSIRVRLGMGLDNS